MSSVRRSGISAAEADFRASLFRLPASDLCVVREDVEHAVVLREHVRLELLEAARGGGLEEAIEEDAAQAVPLPSILDEEGNFGHSLVLGRAFVAYDRDENAVDLGDEGQAIPIVDVGEVVRPLGRQGRQAPEKTQVHRLGAEPSRKLHEPGLIARPDWPDVNDRAVGEADVALEFTRVRWFHRVAPLAPSTGLRISPPRPRASGHSPPRSSSSQRSERATRAP